MTNFDYILAVRPNNTLCIESNGRSNSTMLDLKWELTQLAMDRGIEIENTGAMYNPDGSIEFIDFDFGSYTQG